MKGGARSKAIPGRSIDYIKALRSEGAQGILQKCTFGGWNPEKRIGID